jgi:hypothetical protein
MATSAEDLEAYLLRLDRRFEKVDEQTYLVSLGGSQPPAVLRIAAPVVVVQVDIAVVPAGNPPLEAALFRRLLELNAKDLLHVAYGIRGDRIVLGTGLELPSLDISELESVLSNIDLAIAQHVPLLHDIVKNG